MKHGESIISNDGEIIATVDDIQRNVLIFWECTLFQYVWYSNSQYNCTKIWYCVWHLLGIHSQSMIKLRFDQHVSQLTNFGQWVTLTLTKIWLTFGKSMIRIWPTRWSNLLQKVHDQMTNPWLRLDQVFLVKVLSVWIILCVAVCYSLQIYLPL